MARALLVVARTGSALQVLGVGLYLVIQGRLASFSAVEYAVSSVFGRGLLFRLGLAITSTAFVWAPRLARARFAWRLEVLVAAATLVAFGAFGHAASGMRPYALGVAVAATHLAAVLVWTGGLVCLVAVLRSRSLEPALAVEASLRFSRLATVCVATGFLTGIIMLGAVLGWNVATWGSAVDTEYGRLLLIMVGLALAMLGLGALSRYYLLGRFIDSPGQARRAAFRAQVRREAVLGIMVLLVAAGVTNLPPPERSGVATNIFAPCDNASYREDTNYTLACYVDVLKILQADRGSDAAFEALRSLADANSEVSERLHYLGHQLGEHLFTLYPTPQEALDHCSWGAASGCIDGVIESYLNEVPAVDQAGLASLCKPGSDYWRYTCNHGVGHGVLQFNGYELNQSLEVCDFLDSERAFFCHGGVFMEYGFAYLGINFGHGDAESYLKVTNLTRLHMEPFYPCSSVNDSYAPACWGYQGQLFLHGNDGNFTDAFAKCETISMFNVTCTNGIGQFIAISWHMNATRASILCSRAPTWTMKTTCVEGFIQWVFQANTDPQDGLKACNAMHPAYKQICYYRLGAVMMLRFDAGDVLQACGRAEPGYSQVCWTGANGSR